MLITSNNMMIMFKELDTHRNLLDNEFNCSKLPKNQWTDLPLEILELIVNHLQLEEFLAFRGVCKTWRLATSVYYITMAQTKERTPWILFYRDNDNPDATPGCCLYNESSRKTCTIKIPELEGASCIASKEGWLLVHCHGHVFFLNPFSRAKIDLPGFPYNILPNQVAAFSSIPTKKDCTVFVIGRIDPETIEASTCHWGDREWTKHTLDLTTTYIETITNATFSDYEGLFYFRDSGTGVGTFDVSSSSFKFYRVVYSEDTTRKRKQLPFLTKQNHFIKLMESGPDLSSWLSKSNKKRKSIAFSTCGTSVRGDVYDEVIPYERKDWELEAGASKEKIQVKAVWVMPFFTQLSPGSDYRWTD